VIFKKNKISVKIVLKKYRYITVVEDLTCVHTVETKNWIIKYENH